MLISEPHHIIAIGASAGGLEELNLFFDHTPADGISYVIVQHLSSDFKSRMAELLARHSKLEIKEAEHGMLVRRNLVYLIPHDKFMTIKNSSFLLSDKNSVRGPHMTVNTFFNALAIDYKEKAIAVVLSGLGRDGTEGVRKIKEFGGMVMARDPQTAEFGSMPSSAIATGLVDFVLEPQAMPEVIEDYIKYGKEFLADTIEDELNLKAILDILKDRLPIDFSEYKQSTILRRIKRRAGHFDFQQLDGYLNFLSVTPGEAEALSKEFLISVTSFFRDSPAFAVLEKDVIPKMLDDLVKGEELKLWVAGCATGEEAYSLAILIAQHLTGKHYGRVVKIFATDVDKTALEFAGRGTYHARIMKDVPDDLLARYFVSKGEDFVIHPEIRKMVIFAEHDIGKNPPYCNMRLISCRNLLIYMTPVLQKKVFDHILFGLRKDGYLFLGTSENPLPIADSLEPIDSKWRIYKNKNQSRAVRFDAFSVPELASAKYIPFLVNAESVQSIHLDPITEEGMEVLARNLHCLLLFIDDQKEVIQAYGDTTQFLLQKNFKQNLEDLLAKPLAVALSTLIIKAWETNGTVAANKISGLQNRFVDISVSPLSEKYRDRNMSLVIFMNHAHDALDATKAPIYNEKESHDAYTVSLETELKALKKTLREANVKLNANNENIQSFNEELLSANEEMQSTNEEMQSVNEELHTINSDYQLKNRELLDLNDDLNNYFRSNVNGQLFVNTKLQLVRFSPGIIKQINLLPTDLGRPLSNISTNIKFENIEDDIKTVIGKGTIITKEIETNNGLWYQIMTMPYIRDADNKIDGAIITFNDITALKAVQKELDKQVHALVRINADLDTFVHAASHDLLAPLGNIEGSIEAITTLQVNETQKYQLLNIIDVSIKKFRSLIKDISKIAKVEDEMINHEIINLNEMLDNIEWSLDDKIKNSKTVIERNFTVSSLVFSKKNMRSILYNLVSNAIKFTNGDSPHIIISCLQEGDLIVLSVKDHGIGMEEHQLTKIFDLYGRLHEEIEGQGIGLFLARKLVNAAGGTLSVESKPGSGSDFKIKLKASSSVSEAISTIF